MERSNVAVGWKADIRSCLGAAMLPSTHQPHFFESSLLAGRPYSKQWGQTFELTDDNINTALPQRR